MQTLNDALYQLYMAREVTLEECTRVSGDATEFLRMVGELPPGEDGPSDNGRPQARDGKYTSARR
jgi:twitching motility protein PilT